MKKIVLGIILVILIIMTTGCVSSKQEANNLKTNNITEKDSDVEVTSEQITGIKITIDNKIYIINLENNNTVNEFVKLLPKEFEMKELNGNEKYVYMNDSLPTNASNPKKINAGDVMLYGNNCLVIFYKSFDTSYSYTRIGHIDNLPNLGNGSINVKIEK